MLELKMYPAKNGDAFLINANGQYVLIDGGYASTYTSCISPDLAMLAERGERLSLVVCSHIDADHIGGLLAFFDDNGDPGSRRIEVDAVWHNSLRSVPYTSDGPDLGDHAGVLQAFKRRGFPVPPALSPNPIGASQGSSLAKLLRSKGYHWNHSDGSRSIDNRCAPYTLGNQVQLEVLGPTLERLEALSKLWLQEMRRLGYRGKPLSNDLVDDAYEMWCSHAAQQSRVPSVRPIAARRDRTLADAYTPDTARANGSSIVLVLSAGSACVLLLGDAWAEEVVEALQRHYPGAQGLMFSAIKVAHHGSLCNTSPELLALIDAPCYLVSSNGSRHCHPDFEVLAAIVDRPATFERKLYFNYETASVQRLRSHSSQSGARFSVHVVKDEWIQLGDVNCGG
ncbi:MBL fold metallo-hydrolase [Pseudomonas fluorescens]|uniref:MBL fold metallo-hydrolase n=1 Tax=Pseudomonas fluorescens TaxID=294 RepID=A0A4Y9TP20_PSEFL|nr:MULTISPECIES: AVAST type 1 anti-phage system MBL fold metallo-hydrolase Avs1a [Pseudomonas]MBD8253969.1 MBL fold metallo-hydrolase [Pseudomonas fluorescens]MBD8271674.1 MBL fold metallo-hydrolase [Pseudomonas fluorescens]MDV3056701.1 MBL fold metallo-hydrolase [Pseudomonas paracarnis]QGF93486.1 MBL fold metallo-hydrolase [Pseudomonas sp. CFSAN084952]TFW44199.1 MBL fold metallo-hydrolase [Pseudomonas fluorescens]